MLRRAVESGAEEIQPATNMFYGASSATVRDPSATSGCSCRGRKTSIRLRWNDAGMCCWPDEPESRFSRSSLPIKGAVGFGIRPVCLVLALSGSRKRQPTRPLLAVVSWPSKTAPDRGLHWMLLTVRNPRTSKKAACSLHCIACRLKPTSLAPYGWTWVGRPRLTLATHTLEDISLIITTRFALFLLTIARELFTVPIVRPA
jgi:hypothetical protein